MRAPSKAKPKKIELAKQFRINQTAYENSVWNLLRNRQILNLKWRRQHIIEGYIADFYCPELHLVFELDGGVHDEPEVKEHDAIREAVFKEVGISTIRIKNEECDREYIIKKLVDYKKAKQISA